MNVNNWIDQEDLQEDPQEHSIDFLLEEDFPFRDVGQEDLVVLGAPLHEDFKRDLDLGLIPKIE